MLKKYTKGNKDNILSRINQVSDITLNVPANEKCLDYLYDALMILCHHYINENSEDLFLHIPAIDFYNVVLFTNKCCKEKDVDVKYIHSMISIIRSFENLKRINIVFKNDVELIDSYEKIINTDSDDVEDIIDELSNIYSIDAIEMYLSDMFDQDIIDLINKHFISNGIISNSYLERDF